MRSSKWFLAVALFTLPLFAQTDPLWQDLDEANKKFAAGSVSFGGLDVLRKELAKPPGQKPPYTILSCSDSRVPPELVFPLTRGLGQLFVIRSAGNTADTFGIASIEYAIANNYTKMIVVLGHQDCGAVEEALKPEDPGSPSLVALLNRIRESFGGRGEWPAPRRVRLAVEANARQAAVNLVANSWIIRDAVLSGKVKLVVAYYDYESGRVECLSCPKQPS